MIRYTVPISSQYITMYGSFLATSNIAEEITSETFFKAINSIESFRGDCDMRVWLCQIAKNTYYSYLKKNKRASSIDESDLQSIAAADELIDTQIGEQEEARQI